MWLSPGGLVIRIPERGSGPLCSLGLDGLMERRERITTSQGLGIRTPERGLGPLFSLVVMLLLPDVIIVSLIVPNHLTCVIL